MRRLIALLLVLAMIVTAVVADVLPSSSTYEVYDTGGTHIGSASTNSGGGTLTYTDDPNTNYPPNTNGSYTLGVDGYYHDSSGYRVYFELLSPNKWGWAKLDSHGNTVDSGTITKN